MALDPRQHVSPGDRLGLAASQVNWLNKEMRKPDGVGGLPIPFPQAPFNRIKCKNNSGGDVPRGGVLKITGLAHDYPDEYGNPQQYTQFPVLAGTTPDATTDAWVIAVEPIKDGKIGDVGCPPLVQVKVNVLDADHKWAKPGTTVTELVSTHIGSARIFARQAGTGAGKLAVVELGHRDLSLEEGYDEEADYQFLAHRLGKLEWLHDFNCEELEGS